MIEVQHLTKRYGRVTAVDDLTFRVERGTCDSWLARCAGDECGDDVGGVPIERDTGAVVAHRRARVGVAGGLVNVAQWDTGV